LESPFVALALALVDRLHHHVRYAFSPHYRRVRRRIGEIGKPV
jgi:hypothetical protein